MADEPLTRETIAAAIHYAWTVADEDADLAAADAVLALLHQHGRTGHLFQPWDDDPHDWTVYPSDHHAFSGRPRVLVLRLPENTP